MIVPQLALLAKLGYNIAYQTKGNKVTPHRRGVLFSLHKMLAKWQKGTKNEEQQRNAQLGHCAELVL